MNLIVKCYLYELQNILKKKNASNIQNATKRLYKQFSLSIYITIRLLLEHYKLLIKIMLVLVLCEICG